MISTTALAAELVSGHPVTGPYSSDNWIAANELNAKNIGDVQPMTSGDALQWSAQASPSDTPRLLKIQAAAESNPNDDLKAISRAADILVQRTANLDLNDPEISAMISALEAGTVLSADDVAALTVLETVEISRAAQLGWPTVTEPDVRWARI